MKTFVITTCLAIVMSTLAACGGGGEKVEDGFMPTPVTPDRGSSLRMKIDLGNGNAVTLIGSTRVGGG